MLVPQEMLCSPLQAGIRGCQGEMDAGEGCGRPGWGPRWLEKQMGHPR